MELCDCIKGYEILALSCNRKMTSETVKLLYDEFYKDIDVKKFMQACRNLAKTYEKDKIPPVSVIYNEIRNTVISKATEELDWSKIKGMPDDLKEMLKKWEEEEKFSMDKIIKDDEDLPF